MAEWKAKPFWKQVSTLATDDGFMVQLDTRDLRTPAKSPLVLPTRAMADAVADEWRAQTDAINPLTMPVTRAANAAVDKVIPQFDEVASLIAAYGDADLLCYRAEAPAALVARQAAGWDPLLEWAESHLGARLAPRVGVMHAPQDPTVLDRLAEHVRNHDAFQLAALHDLVSLSGSLVLGLAAARDQSPVNAIWQLSRIDETWQAEQWGVDDIAAQEAETKRQSFVEAKQFLDLALIAS